MSKSVLIGVVLFVLGVVVGRVSVLSGASSTPSVPTSVSAPVVPAAVPSAPTATGASGAKPGGVLRGRAAEVIQVPQYTYVRLESGEWAAVDSAPQLATGSEVTLNLQSEMVDFTSPSTGRTFARLWFATLEGAAPVVKTGAPMNAPAMGAPPADPSVKGALAAVESSNAPVLRVVDVFAEKAVLSGKRVKVTGKVDRVNSVQGLHYVHLKDGTGAAADKTDDLLAISDSEVPAGTTVAMEGVVTLDKNVGMGVNPVVLDQARVTK